MCQLTLKPSQDDCLPRGVGGGWGGVRWQFLICRFYAVSIKMFSIPKSYKVFLKYICKSKRHNFLKSLKEKTYTSRFQK